MEEQGLNMMERVVAYEPQFDRQAYSHEVRDRERLDLYTKRQLETHLGERFNVLLSQTRYDINDGRIFGEDTNEPFMQMLKRGVDYRRENGNPVDYEREEAELVGFGKIEANLVAEDATVGTMMLSVSPPGTTDSIYKHNFYDVFTLREDEKGKYVDAIRYSSSLELGEYEEKLAPFKAFDKPQSPADFLSEPIIIDSPDFQTPDDIHKYLHRNHEYITKEEFDVILQLTAPLITSYINTLSDKPFDQNLQLLTFNAVLNKADIALDIAKSKDKTAFIKNYAFYSMQASREEIYRLGMQPVRIVSTGCGSSGGFSVQGMLNNTASPFSVSDFGIRPGQEKEWFSCPRCKYKANGPVGDTCPGCRLTKEQYVQEGGADC